MDMILFFVYIALSWWAINVIWYDRYVVIFSSGIYFYLKKLLYAIFFGWAAIPIALIMKVLHL